jgi:two-component system NtrC family sensor kinase
MRELPTLRRELIAALALVFVGALLVATAGLIFVIPQFETPVQGIVYLTVLLISDVLIFAAFGHYLVTRRMLAPLDAMIQGAVAIAEGDYERRLPEGETAELERLSDSVNRMAERLIHHQAGLAANVRSLEETNRQLTEARDAMVRAEKMASVGRLASGIAHEVGNPLGAILGYLGLLGRKADESKRELVEAAEKEARRIDRIIKGLLDYARIRESKSQPMDVNAVIDQTIELVSTQGRFTNVDVQIDLDRKLPVVDADPYQLQQVLVNLLVNATDALGETKDARIEVRSSWRVHEEKMYLPVRRKDDLPGIDYSHRRRLVATGRLPREDPFLPGRQIIEITIADNGSGIPRELLEQIFEPFVTTKEPGKGTGLDDSHGRLDRAVLRGLVVGRVRRC